jgi:hypothetical protein
MDLLNRMNRLLAPRPPTDDTPLPSLPFVFVIGAPRSGTTVLTQALARQLDLGYITNIAARFWSDPQTGLSLSHSLNSRPHPTLHSLHGQTALPFDIHEYGNFWKRHLELKNASDIPSRSSLTQFQVTRLRFFLGQIQQFFNRPVIMKGIYPAYFSASMKQVCNHIWINIERDPADVCISILAGREKDQWFGWYPPKEIFDQWRSQEIFEQIARQVSYFQRYYMLLADYTISLEGLCDPGFFSLFTERLADDLGIDPVQSRHVPSQLSFKTHQHKHPDLYSSFLDILSNIQQEAQS